VKRVKRVADIPVVCGAGIKDSSDMAVALMLGTSGVLLSSHVVKAKSPRKILLELCKGTQQDMKPEKKKISSK
jgi:thiazole synthase ThiGH ThiG subunit